MDYSNTNPETRFSYFSNAFAKKYGIRNAIVFELFAETFACEFGKCAIERPFCEHDEDGGTTYVFNGSVNDILREFPFLDALYIEDAIFDLRYRGLLEIENEAAFKSASFNDDTVLTIVPGSNYAKWGEIGILYDA